MTVDISSLPPSAAKGKPLPTSVQVKLESPLPPAFGKEALTARVVQTLPAANGGPNATLQLPTGQQINVTLSPPLPQGSTLSFTPPPAAGAATIPARLVAQAIANQAPPNQPATPARPGPMAPPQVSAPPLPLANVGQALQAAIQTATTQLMQAAIQNPTQTIAPTPPPIPVISSALPVGPVAVQLPATPAVQIPPTIPLTATITAAPNPQGLQAATLSLPARASGQPTSGLPIQVNMGQALPPQTALSLSFPPTASPTAALLLGATLPPTAAATTPPVQPFTPPPLAALKLILAPTATTTPQQAMPTAPLALAGRVLTPPPATPPTNGQPVQQTVLLANGTQAVVQSPNGLPNGSIVVAEINPITGVTVVTRVGAADANQQQQGNAPQTNTGARGNVTAPASTLQANVPAGTTVQGTVTQQNPAQQQITLTLTTAPYQGQILTLQTPQQVPLESTLTVQVQAGGQASVVNITLPAGFAQSHALTSLTQQWPTLIQAVRTLTQNSPAAAATLREHLPQARALIPTLMPYLEAIRTANPERAFGRETIALLRSLGIDFSPDFTQLQTLHQPSTDGWRGVLFPYVEGDGDPQQGGFFWRRQKDEENPERPASTRFVVELALSQLGEIQLDGLLSYPELWLKLRRKTALEPDFVHNLQTVMKDILTEVGLEGGISVESTQTFEIDPVAEILADAHATMATEA